MPGEDAPSEGSLGEGSLGEDSLSEGSLGKGSLGHDAPGEYAPGEIPRGLLEYLAECLAEEPDEVSVERFEEDNGTVILELCVAERDYGRVIGRGGRTAQALRIVVKAAATCAGEQVLVDIVD